MKISCGEPDETETRNGDSTIDRFGCRSGHLDPAGTSGMGGSGQGRLELPIRGTRGSSKAGLGGCKICRFLTENEKQNERESDIQTIWEGEGRSRRKEREEEEGGKGRIGGRTTCSAPVTRGPGLLAMGSRHVGDGVESVLELGSILSHENDSRGDPNTQREHLGRARGLCIPGGAAHPSYCSELARWSTTAGGGAALAMTGGVSRSTRRRRCGHWSPDMSKDNSARWPMGCWLRWSAGALVGWIWIGRGSRGGGELVGHKTGDTVGGAGRKTRRVVCLG